ncbi:(2Fe-2S)-binding protein [Pseudonocardia thermophila]|uniref:(2Fe-2S)-binding protein n=1 Tax=Pseudonocardia thermophila TaxID=1848 RepID=UPI00248D5913|nr:(2Fe-2S)-binding protein [Pseudonocardia thermophila]
MRVRIEVNGTWHERDVEPRRLLCDFLRHDLGLTGTHVGCEHGVCGACTVQVDDRPARSCLMLAVQADGRSIRTVESLSDPDDVEMHPLQEAFHTHHALQCGFCTPGFLMTAESMLGRVEDMTDEELRASLGGNICRCTGYQSIVAAVRAAATACSSRAVANRSRA